MPETQSRFRIVPPRIMPNVDWLLAGVTLALCLFALANLWGATSNGESPGAPGAYVKRQAALMLAGWPVFIGLAVADFRRLRLGVWWAYGVFIILLIGLLIANHHIKGARSWYDLGFFSFQPSEPGKLVMILVLAHLLSQCADRFRGLRDLLLPAAVIAPPLLLILMQPDFGTACVFIPVVATMFWIAGLRKWIFLLFICLGIAVGAAGYPHLKPYQKERIKTFLDPGKDPRGKGYNVVQSQMTLGSGQLLGKGWGKGTQTKMRFLPEFQTDFIFPTLGEQFGLAGCAAALALLALLVWRMVRTAALAQNLFGVLAVAGFTAMIVTHIMLNVGMAIGLLPVTGLPLPFFSYGGSFLLTVMAALGITVSVGARRELP